MVDALHHAALAVADLERAVAFYESVLGFEPLGPDDPEATVETADYYWLAAADDQWVNLAERPDAVPDGMGATDDPHLAFAASEAETAAIADRLRDRGLPVRERGTSVYFRDPAGNYLEVTHWAGPDADRRD